VIEVQRPAARLVIQNGPSRISRSTVLERLEKQWVDILTVAAGEPVRNRLMLALAYDAALRREELCALREHTCVWRCAESASRER
ncbi:hypothetical protein ACFVKB_46155, partial [Rhodococcus sp. NPDC127530]